MKYFLQGARQKISSLLEIFLGIRISGNGITTRVPQRSQFATPNDNQSTPGFPQINQPGARSERMKQQREDISTGKKVHPEKGLANITR
jgi:hypothetical protein